MVVQIPRMDAILMGYCMTGQVKTTMISVIYKSKLKTGNIFRRILILSCEVFLRSHLRISRIISLLGSGRGRVGGLWYAL